MGIVVAVLVFSTRWAAEFSYLDFHPFNFRLDCLGLNAGAGLDCHSFPRKMPVHFFFPLPSLTLYDS